MRDIGGQVRAAELRERELDDAQRHRWISLGGQSLPCVLPARVSRDLDIWGVVSSSSLSPGFHLYSTVWGV